jgi:hypothetical protein
MTRNRRDAPLSPWEGADWGRYDGSLGTSNLPSPLAGEGLDRPPVSWGVARAS